MAYRLASTVILISSVIPATAVAATCESLSTLRLPNTRIIAATSQAAGPFTTPGTAPNAPTNPALANLPAFCA